MITFTKILEDNGTVNQEKNTRANDVTRTAQLNTQDAVITSIANNNYTFVQSTTPTATAAGETWLDIDDGIVYYSTASGTGSWVQIGPEVPNGAIGNINSPLVDLDLQNSLNLVRGAGSVTFTGPADRTYIDRYGILQTAAINTPRFEKEGLLLEAASENLVTYSEQFDNAGWSKTGSSISADVANSPDGNATADKIVEDTSTGIHYAFQNTITINANAEVAISVFCKAAERTVVRIQTANIGNWATSRTSQYDLSTGVVASGDGDIKELANGWYRCILYGVFGASTTVGGINIFLDNGSTNNYAGDGSSGLYVWGAQVEELPFASSYIPTTTVAVTRSAETLSIPYAENFPGSLKDKTVILEYSVIGVSDTTTRIFASGDLAMLINSVNLTSPYENYVFMTNGTETGKVNQDGSNYRFGMTYNESTTTLKMYHDGIEVAEDTSATASNAAAANIIIGEAAAYAHIKILRIWNKVLTASEMRIS